MKGSISNESMLAEEDHEDKFNLKCKYCLRNLSSRQNLKEHLYIHTGEKPYACLVPGCGQSFRQGSLLSIHKKAHSEINLGFNIAEHEEKKYSNPKLTMLIKQNSFNIHSEMQEIEKNEWIDKIGQQNFNQLVQFLNRS